MSRGRILVAAAVASFLFVAAGEAHADEVPVAFSLAMHGDEGVTSLDGCGGRIALEHAVEERLRRPVFVPDGDADIALDVTLERTPSTRSAPAPLVAHILERARDGAELGRRDVTIEAASCDKSIETLAVVLAIMIGPLRTKEVAPAVIAPPPIAPPNPPAPPAPPSRTAGRVDERDARARWAFAPVAEVAFGTGVLPSVALGFQLGVVIVVPVRVGGKPDRLSMIARAHYWPPRSTGTMASADVDRMGGTALGCYGLVRSGMAAFDTCLGFDAARIHASTSDLTRGSETGAVFDVLGEARFGYRFASGGPRALVFEPVFAAQVAGILRRDRFTYRDGTLRERTLLQPSPVAFQASFGLAVHFP